MNILLFQIHPCAIHSRVCLKQLKYFIPVKIMGSLLLSRTAADKNSKCAIACILENFYLVSNFYI
jgi:hypothetical protein